MKLWIAFIALLIASAQQAAGCGFYPFNEDVRFHLLEPTAFGYRDFAPFSFTTERFAYVPDLPPAGDTLVDENIRQWAAYCRGNVRSAEISKAVYELPVADLNRASPATNGMIRYLQETRDTAALAYLRFAKEIEEFNSFTVDPWERTENASLPFQRRKIAEALDHAEATRQPELRARYAFLGIRLAYYNEDTSKAIAIWRKYFENRKLRWAIDYWAMHFRALSEGDTALKNYFAAQVFYHAPDKRHQIYQRYTRMPVETFLRFAKTDKERAAVWLFAGVHNPGRAMTELRGMARCAPGDPALGFLLLRELSKLEDWIYTPTYTYFSPTLREVAWDEDNAPRNQRNVPRDRAYAAELRRFVSRHLARGRSREPLWRLAGAYLSAMNNDYRPALRALASIRSSKDEVLLDGQLKMFRTLWTIAGSRAGTAAIPHWAHTLLMEQSRSGNNRFLFAAGRELEMRGNTTDAALLYSRVNISYEGSDRVGDGGMGEMYWKSRRHTRRLSMDFFYDYFLYLDMQYAPAQIASLLRAVPERQPTDSFERWKFAKVMQDRERLQDMLGTKYIRRNDLHAALRAFEKVDTAFYSDPHNAFRTYLAANPFYTNFYNEHTPNRADTVVYTKAEITRKLIGYLRLANDPATKNRSHYYFLSATAYLNMTQYGNSWMMRRYYWSGSADPTGFEDDAEYFGAKLAEHYFLRAKATATTRMAAAMCVRMAGRCEKYQLLAAGYAGGARDWYDSIYSRNKYWRQLETQYPEYAEDMLGNCLSFEQYYTAVN